MNRIVFEEADGMNIPVRVSIDYDEGKRKWYLRADNYMPRRCYVAGGEYYAEADTEGELIELVRMNVLPLYKNAVKKLEKTGRLTYWD